MSRQLLVRVAVGACLLISAVIHLRLASGYQGATSGGLGIGTLFRLQAATAIAVALAVLLLGNRLSYAAAFAVAASAFVAIMLYRYVDIPAIGPIPAMYEPIWYLEKAITAVVEAAATVLALVGYRYTAGDRGFTRAADARPPLSSAFPRRSARHVD